MAALEDENGSWCTLWTAHYHIRRMHCATFGIACCQNFILYFFSCKFFLEIRNLISSVTNFISWQNSPSG